MIANGPTTQDGQFYEKGQEIPDLGSWVATSVDGLVRNYQGLSADKDKLPKYDNLQTEVVRSAWTLWKLVTMKRQQIHGIGHRKG